ncbi:MAG: tRNA (adenosine(37)-N6)-threonylcarbamoyltransferase complex ATPase subunit type 1 TsaE [Candidatus Theseobacter exili]|nr:tRNA (adenosine(37)-N6)-threonylcarbamoyltransferase complex ATPase subunit type 1 TsaE [Candidatus Theseobacter exili]
MEVLSVRENVFISESSSETRELGIVLGRNLVAGDVLALCGNLGTGKTVLTKGIAEGLGIKDTDHIVVSPSFTLINEYYGTLPLYHFDLYRLNGSSDLMELGIDEYIFGKGVTVIEWAERCIDILPPNTMKILLNVTGENQRKFTIEKASEQIIDKLKLNRKEQVV